MQINPEIHFYTAFAVSFFLAAVARTGTLLVSGRDASMKLIVGSMLQGGCVGLLGTLIWYGFSTPNVFFLWAVALTTGLFPREARAVLKSALSIIVSSLLKHLKGTDGDEEQPKNMVRVPSPSHRLLCGVRFVSLVAASTFG